MKPTRKLLVLDMAFTLEMIRERGLEDSVFCRNLDGYFAHVWTVHPFATLLTSESWTPRYGRPVRYELGRGNTFIEGKIGRFRWLRRLAPLNLLIAQAGLFLQLLRLLRSEEISAIRAGDPLYLGLLAWALSRTAGIPFVVRVGSNNDKIFEVTKRPIQPRLFGSRALEKRIERFVLRRADLVAGANQDNLDFAIASGARPERSTLFRYGNLIDKRHFEAPSARRKDPERYRELGLEPGNYLLYVGRLEAVKHPDDVVRLCALLRERGFDGKAVLAGDGQMRTALVELARELGIESYICFAGNRDQGWLADVIPNAALIVSPHTGRALAEAALGAVPIVAYDIDWQKEVVETGVTGALVPHLDLAAMADAADSILRDPARARMLGEGARRRALDLLDPAALDEHEREQYSALLQRSPRKLAA